MLVKASTNHSKTIEELSNALDSISDAIGLCNVESNLIRSQHVQTAIAKLYIAVFLFFGDAIIWYKSSSASKVLHSLHRDFSERFRKSIDTIKLQAEGVRNAAGLGSQAEVRVVRLDVEQLRGELNDARIGLSGELRTLAEYMIWQQGESIKQHELTQALLSAFRADVMGFPMLCSITPEPRIEDTPSFALAAPVQSPQVCLPPPLTTGVIHKILQNTISRHSENHACGVKVYPKPSQALFDQSLAQATNRWLCNPSQKLLYLEFLSGDQTSRVDHSLAGQIARVLMEAKLPVVTFGQGLRPKAPGEEEKDNNADIVLAMLSLAMDIIHQLPSGDHLSSAVWSTLQDHDSTHDVTFAEATQILEAAVGAAPNNLHIVLLGYPTLWSANESTVKSFLDIVRNASHSDDAGVRMIIISPRKLHNTLKVIRAGETVSLRAASINRSLKAPIVVRRARSEVS
ncbi:hypothetical protein LTR84_009559 [Exophiala bonariae]|uniref:DUF7708 domain-containing protein n=1 Tax=Exophiala bonariae TaxID=1690606 RepID=A0AAV9MX88_9EURO|nr:hypothetical protein LTR84_009559 [Exophiala bonariae]